MPLLDRIRAAGQAFFAPPDTGKFGLPVINTVLPEQPSAIVHTQPASWVNRDWRVADLRAAEQLANSGTLSRAADLCEAMLGDDRIPVVLNTRVNALLGADLSFVPGRGRKKNQAIRKLEGEEDWYTAFPSDRLGQMLLWGRLLGVGLAQNNWGEYPDHGGRVIGRIENYHARFLRQDQRSRKWFVLVEGGASQEVPIEPGDGKWILFTPYGPDRPWTMGLWRGMARLWLLKRYATDDWGTHSEVHGNPIKRGKPPALTTPGQGTQQGAGDSAKKRRQELAQDLRDLRANSAIVLPPGFDFDLVEATARTWEMFQAQINLANTCFAIMANGSNLPTEVSGSQGTGATAQHLVRVDYKKADDEALATATHDQNLTHWAKFNFGDAGLAPWAEWDVEPPADLQARATTLKLLADTISVFLDSNVPIDVEALAEEFELPLKVVQDTTKRATKLYEYHLKYGLLTKNEARTGWLDLPAMAGGEEVTQEPAKGAPPTLPQGLTVKLLQQRAAEHNAQHPEHAVTVEQLSTVWTRGAVDGPRFALGRVNAFLERVAGSGTFAGDDDLHSAT